MAGDPMRIGLPCDGTAPVTARRRLAALLDQGWPLGDAMLVASELVTNALRHSGCRSGDRLVVTVIRQREQVRIEVRDPGRSGGVAQVARRPPCEGGLGLRIVEQLAVRWGARRDEHGYEVWAELPVSGWPAERAGRSAGSRAPARGHGR